MTWTKEGNVAADGVLVLSPSQPPDSLSNSDNVPAAMFRSRSDYTKNPKKTQAPRAVLINTLK